MSPTKPNPLAEEFEAIRKLRGKARQTAVDAFMAKGESVVPVLFEGVNDENKPKRDLATKMLVDFKPSDKAGQVALRNIAEPLLASIKPAMRELGLDLVPKVGPEAKPLAAALKKLLSVEYQDDLIKKAMACVDALQLPNAELVAALDPVLDTWSTPLREQAAATIRSKGAQPRASAWTNCPLADEVVQHIQRLGGKPKKPFDPATPRPLGGSWATNGGPSWSDTDPQKQISAGPPTVWFFDNGIEWTKGTEFGTWDRDFTDRTLSIGGASENYDKLVDGKRRLLLVVGYCSLQHYYCLDLLNESRDPPVYNQDHAGGDAWCQFHSLTKWLAWLKTP
jgi:hypothetical protein